MPGRHQHASDMTEYVPAKVDMEFNEDVMASEEHLVYSCPDLSRESQERGLWNFGCNCEVVSDSPVFLDR